jgi:hypothetical protein
LDGEYNVFSGFFGNAMFSGVLVITIVIQMAMVELSGTTAKCYPLNWKQNLWALLFGFCELPFGVILKKLPLGWFQCIKLDESPATEDKKSIKDILKGGSSFSRTLMYQRAKENAQGSEAAKNIQVKMAGGIRDRLLVQFEKNHHAIPDALQDKTDTEPNEQGRKSTGETAINN